LQDACRDIRNIHRPLDVLDLIIVLHGYKRFNDEGRRREQRCTKTLSILRFLTAM
jgi:hypothetical protein